MLCPAFQDELRHERLTFSQRGIARWQFHQVLVQFVSNQKRRGFHLCLLHFLSLISSLWNWKWQDNYHFILNWSQSMWAGSRQRDKRGKERWRKERRGKKRILGVFGDGSVISTMYRLKGGERWRRGGKGRGDILEIALRVFPWCPSDRNQIGRRAASALWLFYLSGSAGFFLACTGPVLRLCGPLVEPARSLSENNKC